jgi:hypothetical protein
VSRPIEASVIGITSTYELSADKPVRPRQPSTVWILAGNALGAFVSRAWHLNARRQP